MAFPERLSVYKDEQSLAEFDNILSKEEEIINETKKQNLLLTTKKKILFLYTVKEKNQLECFKLEQTAVKTFFICLKLSWFIHYKFRLPFYRLAPINIDRRDLGPSHLLAMHLK
jgi:hypothetical protein